MCSSRMRFHHIVDNILGFGDVAFRWNALYIRCIRSRHFEKISFRFAPLHLFCIPAYTHQIPNGILILVRLLLA